MGWTEEKRLFKVWSRKVAVSSNENVTISFRVAFKKENKFSPFISQCIIWPLPKEAPVTFAPSLLWWSYCRGGKSLHCGLWITHCNSEDPVMPLGTSDKLKYRITKWKCKCTRMILAAAASSVYSTAWARWCYQEVWPAGLTHSAAHCKRN